MLYNMIQPQSLLGSGEDFIVFLLYMGMAAILFNGAEQFEQIVNTLSTESPMRNLVKIVQAISEKKTFKEQDGCCGDRIGFPIGSTQISQWFGRISQKLVLKMAAILDFWSAKLYTLLIYKSCCCFNVSFNWNKNAQSMARHRKSPHSLLILLIAWLTDGRLYRWTCSRTPLPCGEIM